MSDTPSETPGQTPEVETPEVETPEVETPEMPETPEQDEEPAEVEQPGEAAPSPAEPQGSGASEAEWETRFKKAGQRFDTYQRAIFGIFEEDAHDLVQCPLCLQVPGFVDKNAAGRVPQEQADLVKTFLGISRPIEYPHSSQHRTCGECDGLGKVTTGSRVPGKETVGCAACSGAGFIGPQTTVAPANGHVEPVAVAALEDLGTGARDDVDEWNEPRILPDGRENPNFGRMPHRKIQVEPWGVTAGLTAQDAVTAG